MAIKVLVTFATRYGSTHEVAEATGAVLHEKGLEVDIRPVQQVHTLDGYQAIVLGAPMYFGNWHKDALTFLEEYHQALTQRPVAVFGLGPLHSDEKERLDSGKQLSTKLANFPWFTPVAFEMFGGKYDPSALRFADKIVTILPASPLKGLGASDVRDWEAIRSWAAELPGKFQLALQTP